MKKDEKEKNKAPYIPPEMEVIDLSAEEVLAVGCKLSTSGQTAFGNTTFNRCTVPRRCYNPGS